MADPLQRTLYISDHGNKPAYRASLWSATMLRCAGFMPINQGQRGRITGTEGVDFVSCRMCGDRRRVISGRHLLANARPVAVRRSITKAVHGSLEHCKPVLWVGSWPFWGVSAVIVLTTILQQCCTNPIVSTT